MKLVAKKIPHRNRFEKKTLKYKIVSSKNRRTINVAKYCMIVGAMGSGKSTFCGAYLNSIVPQKTNVSSSHGIREHLRYQPINFNSNRVQATSEIMRAIQFRMWKIIGGQCRTKYFNDNPTEPVVYSSEDNFGDILNRPIVKKSLFQKYGGGDSGDSIMIALFDRLSILSFVAETKLLPEETTLAQIQNQISKLAIEFLNTIKGPTDLGKNIKSISGSVQAMPCLYVLKTLNDLNFANPRIGATTHRIKSVFNSLQSQFRLNFEEREVEFHKDFDQSSKRIMKIPVFVFGGNSFYEEELSDTQKIIVHGLLLKTIFEIVNLTFENMVFAFDEPSAYMDPAGYDNLFDFFRIFESADQIFVTTHEPLLLMKALNENDFDVIKLSQFEGIVDITRIKDDPYQIRKTLNRITDGKTFFNGTNNILSSFLENTPESVIILCEGETDVKLFELFQETVLEKMLYSLSFRNFLKTVKFVHFFKATAKGGAGNLRKIIEEFKMNDKELTGKKVFALFDGDNEGFKQAGLLSLKATKLPLHGKLVLLGEHTGYLLQPIPKDVSTAFPDRSSVVIEHALYGLRNEISLKFNQSGEFVGKNKSTYFKNLASFLDSSSVSTNEKKLNELKRIVSTFDTR